MSDAVPLTLCRACAEDPAMLEGASAGFCRSCARELRVLDPDDDAHITERGAAEDDWRALREVKP